MVQRNLLTKSQIYLGGYGNTKSAIKKGNQGQILVEIEVRLNSKHLACPCSDPGHPVGDGAPWVLDCARARGGRRFRHDRGWQGRPAGTLHVWL